MVSGFAAIAAIPGAIVMKLKKLLFATLAIAILLVGISIWMFGRSRCPGARWLNYDVTCRVVDVRADGTSLIEYFDADTNELRVYLRDQHRDIRIEHPDGQVKVLKAALRDNQLKFNPRDDQTLLVNGEVFPIRLK